jgi:PAS domain S-box-containing protein
MTARTTNPPPAPAPASTGMSPDGVGRWLLVALGAGALALGFALINVMTQGKRFAANSWQAIIETGIYTLLLSALILAAFMLRRELARADRRSQALEESERRFRDLADSAPAMIWQADDQGKFVFANGSWLRFRGRSLEQEQAWGWADGLHPDDAEGFMSVYTGMIAQRLPFSIQVRMRSASGDYRAILNHGTPRFAQGGRFIGFMGCCVDIEDIRRAELERETTERRLKVMMNNTPAIAYIKDLEGRYQFVNKSYEEMMKLPSDQIVGKSDAALFPEPSAKTFREADQRVIRNGTVERYEHIVRIGDAERTYLTTKFPLRGVDGAIYGIGGLTTDITDRKTAEELLRQNMQQISDSLDRERTLMRELDHRVRNNIAGLLGLVSIYERTGRTGPEVALAVRGKLLAMRDVHEIISRVHGGPISLGEMARKICAGAVPQTRAADLVCSGPEISIPPAQAHAMAMVLHELVTNSAKHGVLASGSGKARLEWSNAPGGKIRIEWTEDGPGPQPSPTLPRSTIPGGVGLALIEGLCRSELRGSFEHRKLPAGFHAIVTARFSESDPEPADAEPDGLSIEVPT